MERKPAGVQGMTIVLPPGSLSVRLHAPECPSLLQDFIQTSVPRLGSLGPDRLTGIITSLAKVYLDEIVALSKT